MTASPDIQHTLAKPVSMTGHGLFGGKPVQVTFKPAAPGQGIIFQRMDLPQNISIPARVENVVKQDRRTTLKNGRGQVETCEHCMSALASLKIDNLLIQIHGPELPGGDGSARPFLDVLSQGGLQEEVATPRQWFQVTEPIVIQEGDATLMALPNTQRSMQIVYDLDYPPETALKRQTFVFNFGEDDYAGQLAPARTFILEKEARALQQAGVGAHLSEKDVLVIGAQGPLPPNNFRYQDEPVRHKIVDLIGDLYLLGAPIQGRIIAHRSGHAMNHQMVRKLIEQHQHQKHQSDLSNANQIDIRSLMHILPHRYPMLLVDRVLEVQGHEYIKGMKNVTINEPFFQGHYPNMPVMPGVLIVEAMAQLSGVLIGQKLENTGKLAFLMSLDRVKIRKAVTPGDQLLLQAWTLRVRSRIAHMKCTAHVGSDLAAEAEIKYMLVDNEQEQERR